MRICLFLMCLALIASCSKKKAFVAEDSALRSNQTSSNASSGSIYDAGDLPFVDQSGRTVRWNDLRGKVRIMAMIFTHCEYACPRITKDIQNVEKLLPKNDPLLGYTLVSFDTERDTVAQMQKYSRQMGLDSSWLILHGNEANTRTVSALLDVKYEKMADGAFSHQSVILVIDQDGRIAMRHEGLEGDPKNVAEKVQQLLGSRG